mmetsp:Transcript_582/g.900  ORF Transcript_582/g.900 Transcript_582/m.900 type:complete len:277 (-) Transcript_582:632-1462(-)|eukprot:CAMPEP_0194222068 /NCGR_PEP_ID=MMETSP0156-20130528/32037_1 /TAXON_ID=33649 /ORGANISM="Thalassionema nitzschioides, Strain L26-B" /LENGTH=276 /DNA_ID=CAMNT_0038952703 /DNA_START=55 /DNA_END=885 /DNA_ORIENTATION=+
MLEETAVVSCGTSAGPIKIQFFRTWSPLGYDRAVELFERGFYDNTHFFRTVPHFLVQFGISYSTDQEFKKFARRPIPDDPQLTPPVKFEEGVISFAGGSDNSRTSQLFIAYEARQSFGTQRWETPVGKLIDGMENVINFYSGYGDMPPWGKGPVQGKVHSGRSYIDENFPLIDHFERCTVERNVNTGLQDDKEEELIEEDTPKRLDSTLNKKAATEEISSGVKKLRFREKLKQLRSNVETRETSYDLIAVLIILVLFLLAVVFKVTLRGKKTAKTS